MIDLRLCAISPRVLFAVLWLSFIMIDLVPYLPEYLPGIGLSYAAFLLSGLSPGPNILAVMGTSMGAGRKAETVLALGISFF